MSSLREQTKTRAEICKVHDLVTGEIPNWLWVPLEVAEAELDKTNVEHCRQLGILGKGNIELKELNEANLKSYIFYSAKYREQLDRADSNAKAVFDQAIKTRELQEKLEAIRTLTKEFDLILKSRFPVPYVEQATFLQELYVWLEKLKVLSEGSSQKSSKER